MNPHKPHSISIFALFESLWCNRQLIFHMTKRDIIGRYKGSIFGVFWSLFNPLFLLMIYTFVFSVVFNARWGSALPNTKSEFAILLFAGMIVHGLFSESLIRAPVMIIGNVSYVKKIVFPLEILPVVIIGTALFHGVVSMLVLMSAYAFINGFIHWTFVFLPIVLLPLIGLTLGIAWVLSSIGVFLRDVTQPIGMIMTVLLFGSPVFYPVTALPESIRPWLLLNPLTFIIEQVRTVLIFGQLPDWFGLAIYCLVSTITGWGGYAWFQKTRKGFANVL